ncbi:MAG: hypothetical protein ABIH39_03970 [Candidatus Margulisiibacteriota bacterium]
MEKRINGTNRMPSRSGVSKLSPKKAGRLITFLSREQVDFIDRISKDALYSTGKKLSRTQVIQAIVDVVRKLDVSGKDIKTQGELEQRMTAIVKKALPNLANDLKEGIKNETN